MDRLPELNTVQRIYTVSQLNREIRDFLEGGFPPIWISGEISNFACPSSGHWYFSLKDSAACVRCAMFQTRNRALNFKPSNGLQVLMRARISLYEGRGEFQLIADYIEPAGDGLLQKAFAELKQRLAQEGLFAPEHKKSLPSFPQTIGVITSPTGAAIRDIISVLKRRFPLLNIIIYPTAVQGAQAAGEIVQALRIANQRRECEVLIIARGGGSLEDLWPFNDETVARAIYASDIPTVSAIGHEIDVTIADFVADRRAATPSAGAELISPDHAELSQQLLKISQRLAFFVGTQLQQKQQQLQHLSARLRHPKQRLQEQEQTLDNLEQRLQRVMQQRLALAQQQILHLSQTLNALSPLATLDRGYAILLRQDSQQIIQQTHQVTQGDKLSARLKNGQIYCTVDAIDLGQSVA